MTTDIARYLIGIIQRRTNLDNEWDIQIHYTSELFASKGAVGDSKASRDKVTILNIFQLRKSMKNGKMIFGEVKTIICLSTVGENRNGAIINWYYGIVSSES